MAMYELDGNHLLPVRLGRSADAITLSHSLVAIQRQIVDVLRRPLFPLSWEELETGASLTALDATGQVVVVEVLENVDSTGLLAAMSRLTQAATAGRREIASRYAGGLGAFSQDWNEFREAMPAQVEAGPRLTILSASLEPDVVGGLGVLASSGLEIHEVDVRIVDESRIVVVVEKISGMDVAAGGPLLVARAPRPALAGSASAGSNGSRAIDATEQAEHMSPVTGPIEIVMPAEPAHTPETEGTEDASATIPAGAFAATGAADALSELFEPVAVTAEQPQVHTLSAQGGEEPSPEEPDEAGAAPPAGQAASEPDEDAAEAPADDAHAQGPAQDAADGAAAATNEGAADAVRGPETEHDADPEAPQSRPEPDPEHPDSAPQAPAASKPENGSGDSDHPDHDAGDHGAGGHDASGSVGSVGQDLADILSGDTVAVPASVDLGEQPSADNAGHRGRPDSADDSNAGQRAVAALAGGVDILGGSSLSGGSGSAASAGSAPSDAPLGPDRAEQAGEAPSEPGSRTRMGRRSRAAHSQSEASSAAPAAQAWSTVAPNESRPEAPTGAVPLVSWEPLRGSADGLDPVAEALGGDPSKSLLVQETAELAAVAASLGKPTQIIWQRLRRGIYHEAILSVEGVITLSDGRSFTDPTSAANAAQAVTDADGWRVWRVGVHGAHLGDLRDDLADRGL